eukprot:4606930-Lingulodinium_polyedra.AAC.1
MTCVRLQRRVFESAEQLRLPPKPAYRRSPSSTPMEAGHHSVQERSRPVVLGCPLFRFLVLFA